MSTTSGIEVCAYCGMIHTGVCPRVKAIEYYPDGIVKRVEFVDSESSPSSPPGFTPTVFPWTTTAWGGNGGSA